MKFVLLKFVFTVLKLVGLDKLTYKLYWDYYHGFKPASNATILAIEKAFNHTRKSGILLKGDYFEFGVFKGYSLYFAKQQAKKYFPSMKIFGFDSFAGIPELTPDDESGEFYKGQFAVTKERVLENIRKKSGDVKNITLIEGYFYDSLKEDIKQKLTMKKASIINIDSDLYSSAVDVLEFCKSLLMKDTILLFDDWNSFNNKRPSGEEKAFGEFLQRNKSIKVKKIFSYGWHGQAFKVISL